MPSGLLARAEELAQSEAELTATLPSHVAKISQRKRLLLWQEILADIEYPDQGVINKLLGGTGLVGEVPPFGIFEKTFKMSEATVEELVQSTETSRFRQFDK